jgi:hypothetical protein
MHRGTPTIRPSVQFTGSRRIAKDVDGEVTKYVATWPEPAEWDANDVQLRKYIYGPGIDQPICMIEVADANAAYFYAFSSV